jgi:hypothetical protein
MALSGKFVPSTISVRDPGKTMLVRIETHRLNRRTVKHYDSDRSTRFLVGSPSHPAVYLLFCG